MEIVKEYNLKNLMNNNALLLIKSSKPLDVIHKVDHYFIEKDIDNYKIDLLTDGFECSKEMISLYRNEFMEKFNLDIVKNKDIYLEVYCGGIYNPKLKINIIPYNKKEYKDRSNRDYIIYNYNKSKY